MKKFLVLLVMLVAMNANAQWVPCDSVSELRLDVKCFTAKDNYIFAATNGYGLLKSTNNGVKWILDTTGPGYFNYCTSFANSGNNIIASYANWQTFHPSGVFLSTNSGTNWTQIILNPYNALNCVASNGNYVFAGATDAFYISTNNGTTWAQSSFPQFRPIYSLAVNGNYVFAGTGQYGVFRSTNNGSSWTQTTLNNNYVRSLAVNGNYIYAGTYTGLYVSSDNGNTWALNAFNNQYINCLTARGNNIFVGNRVDSINSGGIFLTTNDGISWIDINQGFHTYPPYNYVSVYSLLVTNNFIYASIYYPSISMLPVWRRPLSEVIGIQNISTETPSKYSLSQNYPNPFNSMCNVQFSMCNAGNVKLVVYDVQGREVQTLVNERLQHGTYEAAFNGSALNSGVYFYKLIANSFTETKKMLMIK